MGQLDDKIALVTGATSGTGLGIARKFIAEGATVILAARGAERLHQTAESLGKSAVPLVMDVGDPDSVRAGFAEVESRFQKLDILVNNAAIYKPCLVEKLSDEEILMQVKTNLLGPIHTCRAAVPLMRAAGGGDIINTSSESTLDPFPMLSIYVSTKAGLEKLGEVFSQEVRSENIRVTTLVQGTSQDGNGSTDWGWDPEHGAAALKLWGELGLLNRVYGGGNGQKPEDVGDVHLYIVTRPRSQRLDTVFCRSF